MFFCDPCRAQREWPESMFKSRGPCEICGNVRVCNDVPSSRLPEPRPYDVNAKQAKENE